VIGVINHTHLIKFARYFVVIAFILGAIITPPDPMSQLLLAIPLILLYTFSIGIAWVFGRKKPKADADAS
jgi:sec-independent protein translocase protein TatC